MEGQFCCPSILSLTGYDVVFRREDPAGTAQSVQVGGELTSHLINGGHDWYVWRLLYVDLLSHILWK